MITEEMLIQAAEELDAAIINSLPDPSECTHQFSDRFERKMKHVISRANHPVYYRIMHQAASLLLILFLGFMLLLSISPTARAAFFGWVKEQYKTFTQYYFTSNVAQEEEPIQYQMTYLPQGYAEYARAETPESTTIYCSNRETNKMMYFAYSKHPDSIEYFIEYKEHTVEFVDINGKKAEFIQSKSSDAANALQWSDTQASTFFYISGFLDKSELIKTAENILKINK